jgi:hypothetical protein
MKAQATLQEVLDTLSEMDAQEIAEYLLSIGIKGYPGASIECPIANWLISLGFSYPIVSRERVSCRGLMEPDRCIVNTPGTVTAFIVNYDKGNRYTYLLPEESSM